MELTTQQRLEVIKIIVGIIISVIGALWTYTTYTENERNNELKTLIELGDAIAGMHVTCKSEFSKLADLASEKKNTRQGRCYEYFQDAHRRSLAAVITVKKPTFLEKHEWLNYWDKLQEEIAAAGSQKYQFDSIETAWVNILVAKKLK